MVKKNLDVHVNIPRFNSNVDLSATVSTSQNIANRLRSSSTSRKGSTLPPQVPQQQRSNKKKKQTSFLQTIKKPFKRDQSVEPEVPLAQPPPFNLLRSKSRSTSSLLDAVLINSKPIAVNDI